MRQKEEKGEKAEETQGGERRMGRKDAQDRRAAEPQTRGRNREERWGREEGSKVLACLAPHLSLPNISKSCGYREHQRSLSTSSYSWKASSLMSVFNYPLCVQIGMHWTEMSQVSTPVRAQQSSDAAKIQSIASERQAALKLVATSCVSPHLAGREGRSQHS